MTTKETALKFAEWILKHLELPTNYINSVKPTTEQLYELFMKEHPELDKPISYIAMATPVTVDDWTVEMLNNKTDAQGFPIASQHKGIPFEPVKEDELKGLEEILKDSPEINAKVEAMMDKLDAINETVEKAAEKYMEQDDKFNHGSMEQNEAFVAGAKWQQQQAELFTKDEVLKLLEEPFGRGAFERDEYKARVINSLNLKK